MATLTLTNTFIAGTLAKASEVNANFADVLTWSTNIQDDNIGTLSGPIDWTIIAGVLALDINNSGGEGSIDIAQSAALNPNKASIKVVNSGNDSASSLGAVYVQSSNASTTRPSVNIETAGSGPAIQLRTSSTIDLTVKHSGDIEYDAANGDPHVFKISNSEQFRVTASNIKINNNVGLSDSSSTLLVDKPIKLITASGPQLDAVNTDTLTVSNKLRVVGSGGIEFINDVYSLKRNSTVPNYVAAINRLTTQSTSSSKVNLVLATQVDSSPATFSGTGTVSYRVYGNVLNFAIDLTADTLLGNTLYQTDLTFSPALGSDPNVMVTIQHDYSDTVLPRDFRAWVRFITTTGVTVAYRYYAGITKNPGTVLRLHVTVFTTETAN